MVETSDSAPVSNDDKDELLRKAYGAMVRKWRKRNGSLKQTALSWKAGLPAYAVGALERGERPIILEEIILICKALDLEAPTLLADVREHLMQMARPVIQDLQPAEGSSAELKRAEDLVSERAETLISSMTELDPDQGSGQISGVSVRDLVAAALEQTGGNLSEASRRLGMARNTLKKRMRRYGL